MVYRSLLLLQSPWVWDLLYLDELFDQYVVQNYKIDEKLRPPIPYEKPGTHTWNEHIFLFFFSRIAAAIADALDCKISVQSAKKRVLDCLDDSKLRSKVTLKWNEGQVHVLPMGKLNAKVYFRIFPYKVDKWVKFFWNVNMLRKSHNCFSYSPFILTNLLIGSCYWFYSMSCIICYLFELEYFSMIWYDRSQIQ